MTEGLHFEVLHPQFRVSVRANTGKWADEDVDVDAEMAPLIESLARLGMKTYESCQNYGEYLRFMDFDHVFEAKRDYAYIEFYWLNDAHWFIRIMRDSGVQNPIHHRVVHEGTPDAWELKLRMTKEGHPWVWFPNSDIPGATKLVADLANSEEMALD